jgi:hypothetical protein
VIPDVFGCGVRVEGPTDVGAFRLPARDAPAQHVPHGDVLAPGVVTHAESGNKHVNK